MPSDLKKCPFCGGSSSYRTFMGGALVGCVECECTTPLHYATGGSGGDPDAARVTWNTRALAPALETVIAAVEKERETISTIACLQTLRAALAEERGKTKGGDA